MTLGTLGKYRLVGHLSSGGMADLYRAISIGPEGFRRLVVIKKIRSEFASDPEFLTMFRDEAAIASKLTHSNVAQVYEFDVQEEEPYLVMEFVEGKDLRSILRQCQASKRSIPYPMALYTAAAVADGLQYIHTRKERGRSLAIVHRDISPQNVMISHSGEVKILDFGVARAACRNAETQAGVVKGKYGYMSPEQVRCRPVDHRSDIFSLGVVLWEMLTLRRLFASENDILTAQNVCERNVPPPHHIRSDLPKELDPILQRALAKNPDERYNSAQEFRDDISVFLMSAGAYPTPDQVADFVYQVFPRDMESMRQGEHLLELDEVVPTQQDKIHLEPNRAELPTSNSATRKVNPHRPPDLLPLPSDMAASDADPQGDPTSPLLALPELPESLAPSPRQHDTLRRLALILGGTLLVLLVVLATNTIVRFTSRPDPKPPRSSAVQPHNEHMEPANPAREAPPDAKPGKLPEAATTARSISLTFDVQPDNARVFVDGVRHQPGTVTLEKTPGQPLVVEVSAPNYLREKRLIDAEDGSTHQFRLREAGLLTFIVSPADVLVHVDGKRAQGTRSRFGWEGPAGDAVLVRISRTGMATFEEEVVIPRGSETRTYKLTPSGGTLVHVKTEERGLEPPVPSPRPAAAASDAAPAVAKALKSLLSPTAPVAPSQTARPETEPAKVASPPSPSRKLSQQSPQPQPSESPSPPDAPPDTPVTPGAIRVNARPYADVFFRGKAWGRTPKEIDVEPGTHEVTLKFPTASHTCKVDVSSGKIATCFFDFDPVDAGPSEGDSDQKNP